MITIEQIIGRVHLGLLHRQRQTLLDLRLNVCLTLGAESLEYEDLSGILHLLDAIVDYIEPSMLNEAAK